MTVCVRSRLEFINIHKQGLQMQSKGVFPLIWLNLLDKSNFLPLNNGLWVLYIAQKLDCRQKSTFEFGTFYAQWLLSTSKKTFQHHFHFSFRSCMLFLLLLDEYLSKSRARKCPSVCYSACTTWRSEKQKGKGRGELGGGGREWKNTRKPASLPRQPPCTAWRPADKKLTVIFATFQPRDASPLSIINPDWRTCARLMTLKRSPAQWKQRHVLEVPIWARPSHRITLTHSRRDDECMISVQT